MVVSREHGGRCFGYAQKFPPDRFRKLRAHQDQGIDRSCASKEEGKRNERQGNLGTDFHNWIYRISDNSLKKASRKKDGPNFRTGIYMRIFKKNDLSFMS